MKWSLRVGSLFGIGIYLHWTFLILIGLIVVSSSQVAGVAAAIEAILYVAAVFVCIMLHELGHALAARRYGIPTRDITLLPIGGIARLQRMPEQPLQELVVAVAGPAVNLVIAAILMIGCVAIGAFRFEQLWPPMSGSFLMNLASVNLFLLLFNLLPAFPMDGGRMLRAVLATRMDYTQATNIAAGIGQFMAIAFAMYGLFVVHNPFLLFIALFVYLGADGEARLVQIRMLLRDVPVRDAMMTRFRTLTVDDPLQRAADELLAGTQQEFPVMEDGHFRGILRRDALLQGLKEAGPQTPVGTLVDSDCRTVSERDLLERVMEEMRETACSTLPVLRDGALVGLISLENVGELMMIRSALRHEPDVDEQLVRSA